MNIRPTEKILTTLATVGQWLAFRHLKKSLPQPEYRQQKILQKILRQNRHTQFGQQHQFQAIKNYSDYCRTVPLHNGKTYLPYLNRCREGDYQAICHQQPLFFAMTAGSTGNYKYLPVTPAYVKEVRKSILAFYHCLATACPETRATPIQFIVGSAEGGVTPSGIPAGFMSGFNYKNLPAAIRNKFIIPYRVFTLEHAPDRYYAMARFLVDAQELSAIGAFSPVNISNIAKYAIARLPVLIEDIARGSLTLETGHFPDSTSLQANPGLARQLAAVANLPSKNNAEYYQAITRLLFPGFRYAVCWQGGNMGHATQELAMYFGKKDIFEMPFSASEGIFAIPHHLNQTGGIAAITSHFLEFIPEEEIHLPKPTVLPVWKIETGKYYYLVVTTSGGLYRYNMEDLVRVKGFVEKTPELEFIAKLQRQVSIANERLTEQDVVNAVTRTASLTGVQLDDFVLMPTHHKRYMLLLENNIADIQGFADELEKQLCLAAKGYAFEREDCLLEPVTVAQVGAGELGNYVRSIQFRTDLPTAQFKPVHICNDFDQHREFSLLAQASATCAEAC